MTKPFIIWRRRSPIALGAALRLLLLVCWGGATLARTRDITVAEARELVVQALSPDQRKFPGLDLSPFLANNTPGFYKFEVTWNPPNPGSAVVGNFGVDRVTGAVWELVPCSTVHSIALDRLQHIIRKRINLTARGRRQFEQKAPCEP